MHLELGWRFSRIARSAWVWLLVASVIGAGLPVLARLVDAWGRYIPQQNLGADYLKGVLWAAALGCAILLWPAPARDKPPLLVLWICKVAVTLGFMLLYEWNYILDAYAYFAASLAIMPPAQPMGFLDGTTNIEWLSWLHNKMIPNSYHALKVSFAFVGLLAIYVFYRGIVRALGREEPRLLLFLGLFPSILFWSSILGKDPVQLFGIALYCYGVISWRLENRWYWAIPIAGGILIASFIRVWMGLILLIPLAVFVLRALPGIPRKVLFLTAVAGALFLAAGGMMERFDFRTMDDVLARAESLQMGEGESALLTGRSFDSVASMIAFVPMGAFTALFRPLPGEVMNPFGLLAGLENLFLLTLVAIAISRANWQKFREPLIQWAITFLIVWAGVYAFVSSYNLGAAVRFKLQVLPLLLCLLLYLAARPAPQQQPLGDMTREPA